MKEIYHADLIGNEDVVTEIVADLKDAMDAAFIAPHVNQQVQLACEEALTNIFLHGYAGEGWLSVSCVADNRGVTLILSDKARAYDPTLTKDPDIDQKLEDRPIGGLGIHLIREMMDEFTYQRSDDKNIITMVKRE